MRYLHIALSLVFALVFGCAAQVVNTSKLQYMAPEFTENSLHSEGVSLLPVVAGAGQEGMRRPLAVNLQKHLASQLPTEKFHSHLQTMDLINNANLAEDYAKLIEDYDRSAILNKAKLIQIGEVTGFRYLLYVKLLAQTQSSGQKYSALTGNVVNVMGRDVNIFGQIWDCKIGDIIWEGTGEVQVTSDELTYVKETIDELVNIATISFLNHLPGISIPVPETAADKRTSKGYTKQKQGTSHLPRTYVKPKPPKELRGKQ